MTGYTGGRIQKIKLKHFMTYDSLTLYPKHGLNLIVGLNGSGKSSIMCAICLGLAGKPQHTGRASHLSDFIKHGHSQAIIELELERPLKRNVVICRKINSGNKSEWFLNGEAASLNQVSEIVKSFNIDTSNLCQFLPQEKVVEFSKMNKRQRLENLLQSIGEPHLFELFNELKELRYDYCKIQEIINKLEHNKLENEQTSQRLLPEVEKQEERERVKNELQLFEKRKLMLEYQYVKDKVDKIDKDKRATSAKVKDLERRLEETTKTKNEVSVACRKLINQFAELEISVLSEKLTKNIGTLTEISEQAHSAKVNYENRMKEKANLKKKLENMNIQIIAMEKDLNRKKAENPNILEEIAATAESHEELSNEIARISTEIEIKNMQARKVQNEIKYVAQQLNEMDHEEKRRLNLLKRLDEPTYQGYQWLQQNRTRFRSTIYNPIMMEIKVKDQSNCKYIEDHIGRRDFFMFICENEEDCLQLTKIFNQQKIRACVAMMPSTPLSEYKSPDIPMQFRNRGLTSFLIDLFTAPDPVMRYLCAIYFIHKVPVSKVPLSSDVLESAARLFFHLYYKDEKVAAVKSRYGDRSFSFKQHTIRDQNILTVQDDNRLREQKEKLEALNAENENLLAYMKTQSDIQKSKEELLEKYKQKLLSLHKVCRDIKDMDVHLKQKKQSYSHFALIVIDENEEKEKMSKIIQDSIAERQILFSEQVEIFQKIVLLVQKKLCCFLQAQSSLKKLNAINENSQEIVEELNSAKENYLDLKTKKRDLVSRGMNIKKKIYEGYNMPGGKSEILQNLNHLPNNLDEVNQKIIHFQTQLSLNAETDEAQLEEYKTLMNQIKVLGRDIDDQKNKLASLGKKIAGKKKEWLPQLESHIQNINKNFSQYFKYLQCAGEISLDTCDGTDDFPNYGLQIRLKYREDEPFMELSQTHHSGGECSVAAIIFILSLQELTEVPFRCIDEINQGMDSINERKIYQLIADNSSDGSSSQYFLLTPKLLMNLPYHQNVGVHILHNSCYVTKKIDIKKILQMSFSD